jgi:hypothetical protein
MTYRSSFSIREIALRSSRMPLVASLPLKSSWLISGFASKRAFLTRAPTQFLDFLFLVFFKRVDSAHLTSKQNRLSLVCEVHTRSQTDCKPAAPAANPHPLMNSSPTVLRRLGPGPDTTLCAGGRSCPDIFELSTGDFAIIGTDITDIAAVTLPKDAGCGPTERIVQVPRRTLVLARPDIPAAL